MLVVYDLIPKVYYNESRDFQVFGRSFEIVFNYLKTNVDLINSNPLDTRSNYNLIKLIAKTLGFESKHEYSIDDLRVVASVFTSCLRCKGTSKSVDMAIKALLHAQHLNKNFRVSIDEYDSNHLVLYLPREVTDVVLLEDLFEYILPTGMIYSIHYGDYSEDNLYHVNITTEDSVKVQEFRSSAKDSQEVGLGSVWKEGMPDSSFANITELDALAQTATGLSVTEYEEDTNND